MATEIKNYLLNLYNLKANCFFIFVVVMIRHIKTEDGIDHYKLDYEGEELDFFVTPLDRQKGEVSVSADLLRYLQASSSLGNDLSQALIDAGLYD